MKPFLLLCLTALLLSACGSLSAGSPQASPTAPNYPSTRTPFQPEGFTPPPTASSTPVPGQPTDTPTVISLYVSPAIPASLRQSIPSVVSLAANAETANVRLDVANPQSEIVNRNSSIWFYTLVAPFPTIPDGVALTDIQNAWAGKASGPFAGRPLWMDASTLAAFAELWGAPASGAVSVASAESLVDSVWAAQPAWAIVPFEALVPRWKVLSVDGQSPVHNDFNADAYPLRIGFSLQPAIFPLPAANRDPSKLTVLAMTGVTALVRGTADQMEKHGVLYPGEEVRSVLRAADLTHISNEVSFDPACPTPDPWTQSLSFCSATKYMALLEDVGTDIIELSGNHLIDYGRKDALSTLDMYDQAGMKYFAGGRDLAEAQKPLLITDHGNKLAFLGCNYTGPQGDWATETTPGSAPCDFDQMHAQIADLRAQGYLPVVTFQYDETYFPEPTDYELRDFPRMADAGAVIVSGSQSHVPQAMEFDGSSFIHFGLGNLFFDQMAYKRDDGSTTYDTRDIFIDRHVFYDGKYLGTELLTYRLENYARPRLMTDAERAKFLQRIFAAAGW